MFENDDDLFVIFCSMPLNPPPPPFLVGRSFPDIKIGFAPYVEKQ